MTFAWVCPKCGVTVGYAMLPCPCYPLRTKYTSHTGGVTVTWTDCGCTIPGPCTSRTLCPRRQAA